MVHETLRQCAHNRSEGLSTAGGINEDDVARGLLAWLDAPRAAQATAAKVLKRMF